MIGVMMALASLFADQIALGMPGSGFGLKQIAGTLAGILIAVGGLQVLRRYPSLDGDDGDNATKDEQA